VSPRARRRDQDSARAIDTVSRLLADRDRTPYDDQMTREEYAEGIVQGLMLQGWRCNRSLARRTWEGPSEGAPASPEEIARHVAAARAALPTPRPRQGQGGDGA